MNKVQHFDHHVDINDLKPIVNAKGIYFPLTVENGYIEEDGLSFGYPVDCGNYSIVTYEKAVGVLAEDTQSMAFDKNSEKVLRFHLLDFVDFRTVKGWDADLPAIDPELVWDLWPAERRNAYSAAHDLSELEFTDSEKILDYQGQQLYKKNGEYFAACGKHWNYGHITPVEFEDGVSEEMVLGIMESKKRLNEAENNRIKQLNKNIQLLSTIFGHTAA